jgi:RNA polymerase sigma-B factor
MLGSRRDGQDSDHLESLDRAAVAYAREWRLSGADRRGRLRDDLICRCLPLANRMARRYGGRAEPLDDLEQVARVALINAVDRYDPDRGSFTAFAVITIGGEIKRHFRDKTWGVHVTRRMQDLALELGHATVVLTNTLARNPSTAELASHLAVSEDEVRRARESIAGHTPLPLSSPTGPNGDYELGDQIGGRDEAMEIVPDRLTADELIHQLPHRIQYMLALRFHGNLNQTQIAGELGISQMHVSRLLTRALTWLRAAMLSDVAPAWTDGEGCHRLDGLQVRTSQAGETVTVAVHGEVDRDTADRLRFSLHSAVAMASAGRVVIDVSGMPLMDAAGAAVLRDAYVTAKLARVTLAFTGVQPHVAVVLAAVGLPPWPDVPGSARRPPKDRAPSG